MSLVAAVITERIDRSLGLWLLPILLLVGIAAYCSGIGRS
jgi:hypothetical protein